MTSSTPSPADAALLADLADVALRAGAAIRKIEGDGMVRLQKADLSPVTDADHAAEAIILKALEEIAPGVPVVAEEATAAGVSVECGSRFFLVDPLDGTREFISGNGEYTVNIALIVEGTPHLGIVYAPARGLLYAARPSAAFRAFRPAGSAADAAQWTPIACRPRPKGGIVVAASRSHGDPATEALIAQYSVAKRIAAGSALKFGLVAEGLADFYPRLGPVMEWDAAAGHCLIVAAGGSVTKPDGAPLTYGHTDAGYRVTGFLAQGPLD